MASRKKKKRGKPPAACEVMEARDLSGLYIMLPGRKKQVDDIVALFGEPSHYTVSPIFIYGHSSCGKSVVSESIMQYLELPYVIVNCVECYTLSILFQEILRGLYLTSDKENEDYELPKKCENMNDFVRNFRKLVDKFHTDQTVYIILKKAERLRSRESYLLPALNNLQELTARNVCVIFLSILNWEKYGSIGGCDPHIMFFPSYTKDELQAILSFLRPSEAEENFYKDYTGVVLSVFHTACRDLRELRHLAAINYPIYCEPIRRGSATAADRHKLWKHIEPHLKQALHTLYLREIPSAEWTKMLNENDLPDAMVLSSPRKDPDKPKTSMQKEMIELPFYSKFLVIAAYIASYNPVKSDIRFFVKNAGKMKKTLKSMKKDEQKSAHLRGPKAFPMDRMMAIFYSIVEERVLPSANISSQISSLVSLHLLSQVGLEDQIDSPKYICSVSLDFVQAISRTVDFDIMRYLYDFI